MFCLRSTLGPQLETFFSRGLVPAVLWGKVRPLSPFITLFSLFLLLCFFMVISSIFCLTCSISIWQQCGRFLGHFHFLLFYLPVSRGRPSHALIFLSHYSTVGASGAISGVMVI